METNLPQALDELKKNHKTSYFAYEYEKLTKQRDEVSLMLSEFDNANADESMASMAKEEIALLDEQIKGMVDKMNAIMKEDEDADKFPSEIILEVRAGAGGEEAALFASQLATMYQNFANLEAWQCKQVDASETKCTNSFDSKWVCIEYSEYLRQKNLEEFIHRLLRLLFCQCIKK